METDTRGNPGPESAKQQRLISDSEGDGRGEFQQTGERE